jgi:hypothetical protein
MEGIFLTLIGAVIFSQSWHILGMYAEGRTMGIIVGALGLMSLSAIVLAPVLLTGQNMLIEATVLKTLIGLWAVYAIAVAAHGIWDLDERAIGFYSAFLALATFVPFIYFAVNLEPRYGTSVWLGLSASTLILTMLATIVFFYQAFILSVLRLVAGWFFLLGGAVIGLIGIGIVSGTIA